MRRRQIWTFRFVKQQRLKGDHPVLVTAWTDDGQFDPASQARLIEWLIDSGAHRLAVTAYEVAAK